MRRKQAFLFVAVLAAILAWRGIGVSADGGEVPRMTKEELEPLLGNPEVVILDVRSGGGNFPTRIAGAVYEDPGKVDDWSSRYPKGKRVVLYCS